MTLNLLDVIDDAMAYMSFGFSFWHLPAPKHNTQHRRTNIQKRNKIFHHIVGQADTSSETHNVESVQPLLW